MQSAMVSMRAIVTAMFHPGFRVFRRNSRR
jgi:hypothetical protein